MARNTTETEPPEYTVLSQRFPQIAAVVRQELTSMLAHLRAQEFISSDLHGRLLENVQSSYDKAPTLLNDVLELIKNDKNRFKDFLNILAEVGSKPLVETLWEDYYLEVNDNYWILRSNRHLLVAAFNPYVSLVQGQLSRRQLIDGKAKERVDNCEKSNQDRAILLAKEVEQTVLKDSRKFVVLLEYLKEKFESTSLGTILAKQEEQGRQEWYNSGRNGASKRRKRIRRNSCSDLRSKDTVNNYNGDIKKSSAIDRPEANQLCITTKKEVRDHPPIFYDQPLITKTKELSLDDFKELVDQSLIKEGKELSEDDFKELADQSLIQIIKESKRIQMKKKKKITATRRGTIDDESKEEMTQMKQMLQCEREIAGEREISALKEEIQRLTEQKGVLEDEKQDLSKQKCALEAEKQNLSKKEIALEAEKQNLFEKKIALEAENVTLLHKIEKLNLELTHLKKRNADIEKMLEVINKKDAVIESKDAKLIKFLEEEKLNNAKRIKELEKERDNNVKKINELEEKLKKVRKNLNKAKRELTEIKQKLGETERKLGECEQEIKSQEQKDLKNTLIQENEEKILQMQEEIQSKHNKELETLHSKHDKRLAEMKNQLDKLSKELSRRDDMERRMKEEISDKITGMEERLGKLEKE